MKNIEKNVTLPKAPQGSFEDHAKEPFSKRLRELQGSRSLYRTAKDWGVSLSTLKNYFSRQGSVPRHEVLTRISECEGVSIEWLLNGDRVSNELDPSKNARDEQISPEVMRLATMLSMLPSEDVKNLEKVFVLKGIETVLYLLDEDNIELLRQDPVVKEMYLARQPGSIQEAALNAQEKRERDTDSELQTTENDLANSDKKKQAR